MTPAAADRRQTPAAKRPAGLRCPACSGPTGVLWTRARPGCTRRSRRCQHCGRVFHSDERLIDSPQTTGSNRP